MEIRSLRVEEFDASLNLSEYAFQYKVEMKDREEQRKLFIPERSWGAFENGELLAKLMLLPLHLYVQGRPIPMGGIAGVATWPEHRRSGLVRELLAVALRQMNEQGQILSCLHPFSIPFYRKFGWEVHTDYKKYTMNIDSFPSKTLTTGSVKRDIKNIELLNEIYHSFARQYNGMLVRDEEWWKRMVLGEEGHTAVYYAESGQPEGYLLYQVKNRELVISEFVFLNETARQGLWTYLANHDSMVTQVVFDRVPADDLLPFLLRDPRCKQETVPYFMARIVNAAAFVAEYSFAVPAATSPIRLSLRIEDGFAPWNEGNWQLAVSPEGKGSLTPANPADFGLVCDIQTLTALLLGYKRPREMFACGKLSGPGTDAETLERLIPLSQTALLDFF
ncbi:GNAT family N-acetyltransferase [Paenibacillus sp. MBLB2552]|uniref:GNAT family N-acetyltransferase n=1 Tax=Paenibacillus mellifer TaxID=2937794 RepID=A0A9X1Y1Y8_9BACL|nr:GNAT family N-acetyltransferase [Paenibacillus mellifer]MCK8489088.1 GNAT family N-acetyltransferase [Paenibacillus mellifer]